MGVVYLPSDRSRAQKQGYTMAMEDSGFKVHDESEGRTGLAWFEKNRPDLVLTDLRMPDMDGLSILGAVKEIDEDVPVIVVSGMGMVNDVAEALRLGAADYLTKPITDMEVLVHSITRSLALYRLHIENRRYRSELESANRELKEYIRVLERDQQAGRQVQSNLLPPTPVKLNNLNIAHKIIPSLYLSGDFIDYGVLFDRYVAFYLTDVSGHGASSAFVTVWLKQRVNRLFREKEALEAGELGNEMSKMLQIVNKEIIRSKFGCHLTCFVGILDTHTNKLTYIVAGHLPLPVMLTAEGAQFVEGKGKPVGIFEDATWQVYEVTLPEVFSLMAFSDGILEIMPSEDLSTKEQQLLDLVSNTEGSISKLVSTFTITEATSAPDDIAILSLFTETGQ